jgi:hypothetical protein
VLQTTHQFVQALLPRLIHSGGWLVEQEYVRIADECERDEQLLDLPSRLGANGLSGDLGRHTDKVQETSNVWVRLMSPRGARAQEIDTGNWHVTFEIEFLRNVADPGSRRPPEIPFERDGANECPE